MKDCTCKITPGTSAYGGNRIDSRGCEKHDTRDEIIEQLRQERDNALRYTELLIAERDAARAEEARAVEALEAEQHAAHWRNLARITDKHEDHLEANRLSEIAQRLRHGVVLVGNSPALDWLAQQRAKAVAAWIEKQVAENLERYGTHYYERTTDDLMREAAAFRAAALRAGEVGNE